MIGHLFVMIFSFQDNLKGRKSIITADESIDNGEVHDVIVAVGFFICPILYSSCCSCSLVVLSCGCNS